MNRSLLIVENDPQQLQMLARRFTRAGYDVLALGHPRHALEAASFRQFQVAVVDAGQEGLDLIRRLKPVQSALQAVVLSREACPDQQHQPDGLVGWFVKPCRLKQLEAIVAQAFRREGADAAACLVNQPGPRRWPLPHPEVKEHEAMDYQIASNEAVAPAMFAMGSTPPQHHVGRRVLQAAEGRLRASTHTSLRALVCEFRAGVLVLRGEVCSHYLRQLAQETMRSLAGVAEIVNLVEVVSNPAP